MREANDDATTRFMPHTCFWDAYCSPDNSFVRFWIRFTCCGVRLARCLCMLRCLRSPPRPNQPFPKRLPHKGHLQRTPQFSLLFLGSLVRSSSRLTEHLRCGRNTPSGFPQKFRGAWSLHCTALVALASPTSHCTAYPLSIKTYLNTDLPRTTETTPPHWAS